MKGRITLILCFIAPLPAAIMMKEHWISFGVIGALLGLMFVLRWLAQREGRKAIKSWLTLVTCLITPLPVAVMMRESFASLIAVPLLMGLMFLLRMAAHWEGRMSRRVAETVR